MKKLVVLVIVLALLAPAGAAFADPGDSPNAENFLATCEGFGTLTVAVTGEAGHTSSGIGIARTLYADGQLIFAHPGQGYTTVWCTWTFEGDPTQYSGDVQVAPPGGR